MSHDKPQFQVVELEPVRNQLPQVQPQAQPSTQSIIDSLIIRWSKSLMVLVVIPVMLAAVYHVGSKLENHDTALAVIQTSDNNIQTTLNDIKQNQKDLKDTVASLASQQNLDEKNIAGLQQADIDRGQPTPTPEPPAPVERRLQHHSSRAHPPDIFAAIEKAFTPAHGLRARASVPERGK